MSLLQNAIWESFIDTVGRNAALSLDGEHASDGSKGGRMIAADSINAAIVSFTARSGDRCNPRANIEVDSSARRFESFVATISLLAEKDNSLLKHCSMSCGDHEAQHAGHGSPVHNVSFSQRCIIAAQFLLTNGRMAVLGNDVATALRDPTNQDIQCPIKISLMLAANAIPIAQLSVEDRDKLRCIAYAHQDGPPNHAGLRNAESYRATNLAIASVVHQETYRDKYFWFDQLFGMMDSDFFEGGWAGVEFDAYYCQSCILIHRLAPVSEDPRLWARIGDSAWFILEQILSSLGTRQLASPSTANIGWARNFKTQLMRLRTNGASREQARFVTCLLIDQWASPIFGDNDAYGAGSLVANGLLNESLTRNLNLNYAGAPTDYHSKSHRFLKYAGFLQSAGIRARLCQYFESAQDQIFGQSTLQDLMLVIKDRKWSVSLETQGVFVFRHNHALLGCLKVKRSTGQPGTFVLQYDGRDLSKTHQIVSSQ